MNIGFDILMSDGDVTFATQTGIEIICNIIIMYEHTYFLVYKSINVCKTSMGIVTSIFGTIAC